MDTLQQSSEHSPTGYRPLLVRQSIPILPCSIAPISKSQGEELAAVAARISADEPALGCTSFFGAGVKTGIYSGGPALLIGDEREIALTAEEGAQSLEYRISHLATSGDMILLSGNRNCAFENYRQNVLGLGAINVIALPTERFGKLTPLATRCLIDAVALNRIVATTQEAGSLTILPHVGRGRAWRLAAAIAEQSGISIRVAAPPPRLTRRVNDKIWFANRVNETFGQRAQPLHCAVFGPLALAAHARRLARRSERVVIKVPDSAGSAGNLALSSVAILNLSTEMLREFLICMLRRVGWNNAFPLLVELWDAPVLASPSVQTWIPAAREGPPALEGIFEQMVAGPNAEFVGSAPTVLPQYWRTQIGEEALRLATLFQLLGYFGRCSFDALIVGCDYSHAALHWIECNGRWGGVSVPMTLANRLTKDRRRSQFVVVQRDHVRFPPCRFSLALKRLAPILYRAGRTSEGVVFVSPVGIERGNGVHLMALAEDVERANELAELATKVFMGQATASETKGLLHATN